MPDTDQKLGTYRAKRDFQKTPEPDTEKVDFAWAAERPIFVIQKHAASTLHYDFRLEVDGVLKSWAVPKGPSTDPRERRLAVPTEDHPMAYADFEGTIPEGEYGGGTVLIWDRGAYRNLKEGPEPPSVADQLAEGHATIWLEGEKLRGGYALIRTGRSGSDEAKRSSQVRWLLIKMDDEQADAGRNVTESEPRSVHSGRTLDEIRAQAG